MLRYPRAVTRRLPTKYATKTIKTNAARAQPTAIGTISCVGTRHSWAKKNINYQYLNSWLYKPIGV